MEDILEQVKGVTENEFKKRNLNFEMRMDSSAPDHIRASHLMFRQVVLNLLTAVTSGSVRASIEIVASG